MVKSNTRLGVISPFVSIPLFVWLIIGFFFFKTTTNPLVNFSFLLPPVWFFVFFLQDGFTSFWKKPQVPFRSRLVSLIGSILLAAIPLIMCIEVLSSRFGIDGLTIDASWYSMLLIVALIGMTVQSLARILDTSTEQSNQEWLSYRVMVVVGSVLFGLIPFFVA